MNYGAVLSRAWKIIWRHKVLWIFGILAGCGSASYSGPNVTYQTDLPYSVQQFIDQTEPGLIAVIVIAAILVILALILLLVFLSTIGRIGIIRGTQLVDQGTERLTFGDLFRGSTRYFWRVFALGLLLVVFSIVVIGGVVFFGVLGTIATLGIGLICFIPLLCLLVVGGLLLSVLFTQASIAIIVEDARVMNGLDRGWQVIKQNIGEFLVMALILTIGVNLIVGFIIAAPLWLVMGAALPLTILQGEDSGAVWLVAGICLIIYLPALLLLSGILRSYIDSSWTLTYLRLAHPSGEAG